MWEYLSQSLSLGELVMLWCMTGCTDPPFKSDPWGWPFCKQAAWIKGRALHSVWGGDLLKPLCREEAIKFISEQGIKCALIGYQILAILQDYSFLLNNNRTLWPLLFLLQMNYIKPGTLQKRRFDFNLELTWGHLKDKRNCSEA